MAMSTAVNVSFYRVDVRYKKKGSWRGTFPIEDFFGSLSSVDYMKPESRVPKRLFGEELVCIAHSDRTPILGAYAKDLFRPARTEANGKIAKVELDIDEGLVKSSYGAFFEPDIFALMVLDQGSPTANQIATWMTACTDFSCLFRQLKRSDPRSALRQGATEYRYIEISADEAQRGRLQGSSRLRGLANALNEAAGLAPGSMPLLRLTAPRDNAGRRTWWPEIMSIAEALVEEDALKDVTGAYLGLSSERRVDLRDPRLVVSVATGEPNRYRIDEDAAATALFKAFEMVQDEARQEASRLMKEGYDDGDQIARQDSGFVRRREVG
jgi:hypothetical protein